MNVRNTAGIENGSSRNSSSQFVPAPNLVEAGAAGLAGQMPEAAIESRMSRPALPASAVSTARWEGLAFWSFINLSLLKSGFGCEHGTMGGSSDLVGPPPPANTWAGNRTGRLAPDLSYVSTVADGDEAASNICAFSCICGSRNSFVQQIGPSQN
ncbi:hypothetical protein COCOBI_12-1500 [Coccomyxa sp. Obi]|nr:hypothetical protein COCOBI_12-1500 [Coccomyxa sp. Obi]